MAERYVDWAFSLSLPPSSLFLSQQALCTPRSHTPPLHIPSLGPSSLPGTQQGIMSTYLLQRDLASCLIECALEHEEENRLAREVSGIIKKPG